MRLAGGTLQPFDGLPVSEAVMDAKRLRAGVASFTDVGRSPGRMSVP